MRFSSLPFIFIVLILQAPIRNLSISVFFLLSVFLEHDKVYTQRSKCGHFTPKHFFSKILIFLIISIYAVVIRFFILWVGWITQPLCALTFYALIRYPKKALTLCRGMNFYSGRRWFVRASLVVTGMVRLRFEWEILEKLNN